MTRAPTPLHQFMQLMKLEMVPRDCGPPIARHGRMETYREKRVGVYLCVYVFGGCGR